MTRKVAPSRNISLYLQERTIDEIDRHIERVLRGDPARRKMSRSEAAEHLLWTGLQAVAKGKAR
jgi:hypothetical protein